MAGRECDNGARVLAFACSPRRGGDTDTLLDAALAGAAEMLLSRRRREEAELWAAKIRHTKPNELEPEFVYMVADNMYF